MVKKMSIFVLGVSLLGATLFISGAAPKNAAPQSRAALQEALQAALSRHRNNVPRQATSRSKAINRPKAPTTPLMKCFTAICDNDYKGLKRILKDEELKKVSLPTFLNYTRFSEDKVPTFGGATLLMVAAHQGREKMVTLLMDKGALVFANDVRNNAMPLRDLQGKTTFTYASENNNCKPIMELLFKQIDMKNDDIVSQLFVDSARFEEGISFATMVIDRVDLQDRSLLVTHLVRRAMASRDIELLTLLSKKGVTNDLVVPALTDLEKDSPIRFNGTRDGKSPVEAPSANNHDHGAFAHICAAIINDNYHNFMIGLESIEAQGASCEEYLNDYRDQDGTTPLMVAARLGRLSMIKELISRGADPYERDNLGQNSFVQADKGASEGLFSNSDDLKKNIKNSWDAYCITKIIAAASSRGKMALPSGGDVSNKNLGEKGKAREEKEDPELVPMPIGKEPCKGEPKAPLKELDSSLVPSSQNGQKADAQKKANTQRDTKKKVSHEKEKKESVKTTENQEKERDTGVMGQKAVSARRESDEYYEKIYYSTLIGLTAGAQAIEDNRLNAQEEVLTRQENIGMAIRLAEEERNRRIQEEHYNNEKTAIVEEKARRQACKLVVELAEKERVRRVSEQQKGERSADKKGEKARQKRIQLVVSMAEKEREERIQEATSIEVREKARRDYEERIQLEEHSDGHNNRNYEKIYYGTLIGLTAGAQAIEDNRLNVQEEERIRQENIRMAIRLAEEERNRRIHEEHYNNEKTAIVEEKGRRKACNLVVEWAEKERARRIREQQKGVRRAEKKGEKAKQKRIQLVVSMAQKEREERIQEATSIEVRKKARRDYEDALQLKEQHFNGHSDTYDDEEKEDAEINDVSTVLDKKQQQLHEAISEGHYNIAMKCIRDGANPYKSNEDGESALDKVRKKERYDILETMLILFHENKQKLDDKKIELDNRKKELLEIASKGSFWYIDRLCEEYHTNALINTVEFPLENSDFNIINCLNERGETPLLIALKRGHIRFVDKLIKAFPVALAGLHKKNNAGEGALEILFDVKKKIIVSSDCFCSYDDLLVPLLRNRWHADSRIVEKLVGFLFPEGKMSRTYVCEGIYTIYELLDMVEGS